MDDIKNSSEAHNLAKDIIKDFLANNELDLKKSLLITIETDFKTKIDELKEKIATIFSLDDDNIFEETLKEVLFQEISFFPPEIGSQEGVVEKVQPQLTKEMVFEPKKDIKAVPLSKPSEESHRSPVMKPRAIVRSSVPPRSASFSKKKEQETNKENLEAGIKEVDVPSPIEHDPISYAGSENPKEEVSLPDFNIEEKESGLPIKDKEPDKLATKDAPESQHESEPAAEPKSNVVSEAESKRESEESTLESEPESGSEQSTPEREPESGSKESTPERGPESGSKESTPESENETDTEHQPVSDGKSQTPAFDPESLPSREDARVTLVPEVSQWESVIHDNLVEYKKLAGNGKDISPENMAKIKEILFQVSDIFQLKLNDSYSAWEALVNCFELNPKDSEIMNKMEDAGLNLENEEVMNRLVDVYLSSMDPDDMEFSSVLCGHVGKVYFQFGDFDQAKEYLEKAILLDGTNVEAETLLTALPF